MELNALITNFHCFQEYSKKNVKLELKNCKLITIFKSGLDWMCYLAAKYKVVPTIFFTFIFPG